jgi:hydroxymethylbilane synthase
MLVSSQLDDPQTHAAITAERAVLAQLGGGCQVPVGAYAELAGDLLRLRAVVISPDGKTLVKRQSAAAVADAERLGSEVGRELLDAGARDILAVVYGHAG